ncbi:FAD-binding and (Fe-S)-binding domain-containing protein [Actinorugispora endophytica]|uniref:FAD/FMN-containing dehydrogenase n=1 Tax=Actinorugispora endophytica TaxID=1605990 RepID=A0A4R6VBX3_9ACTN|nr:FAD-binding and (Fe-S)-binding domain-containing protein [Actinorugispora endophytica]TDQ54226.1 FAD/FMN-containing dehydrogenase [Actinorugispora endophytica]
MNPVRSGTGEASALAARLRGRVGGEVSDSARRRAEYSTDASNYRVVPDVVVFPRDNDDVLAALDIARGEGAALTCRGGGTSVAGNAIGPGIVLDFSRHMNRIVSLDPGARSAVVQPGVVLADLQRAAAPHGLRFGPDPSTQARATLGGMIGNNACGPHAVAYGRTSDNVRSLTAVDGTGRRFTAGTGLEAVPGLGELVDANLAVLRTELGRFPRQVSGYSLEHLLPENGRSLARALVGSEGTVAVTLDATVRLVETAPARVLVVLGYPGMADAADAVPRLLGHRPLAVEGLDARLVDVVRRHRGEHGVPDLPRGGGWLMVEVGGESAGAALEAAGALAADAGALGRVVLPAGAEATAMWRIREDGAGLAGRTPAGNQAWPGWEDAAVPPERLGGYLREFESLMARHGVDGLPYGHFGDGCVHVRVDVPLERDGSALRSFLRDAAALVVAHGGSLSGEHGDGRARGELLPLMYSRRAIDVFGAFKALFDPEGVLNPGVLVGPAPVDADLRRPSARPLPAGTGFAFAQDGGDFTRAVHRCVGVGKCRADNSAAGGFMCPSYLATRDEKDSTRGRARVLQDMANGGLVRGGWSAPEVRESLDLCLSCKACVNDCPAGVDMAQYKSEVLHRAYAGRRRPVSHYSLGRLPGWLALLDRLPVVGPAAANAVFSARPLAGPLLALAGVDPRRRAPRFPRTSFTRWWRRRRSDTGAGRPEVVLWADSFTDGLGPDIARAAAEVLADAGYRVVVPERRACCGLTRISTGQLDGARRRLSGLLDVLGPYAAAGIPVVGLEPSCAATLRSDLVDLLPDDPRARVVSGSVATLAELLTRGAADGRPWSPPDLGGVTVLAQPHCHQHAVMGYQRDLGLLRAAGARVTALAGCCGLAGNFGMERGHHYDVSVAVAGNALLPALRGRDPETVFLADGFSCRTQAEQLAGVRGVHLAQLLAARLRAPSGG